MAIGIVTNQELHSKAYKQGHHAGLKGLPWSPYDWEPEFVPSYRQGHNDGKAERQRESVAPYYPLDPT